MDHAFDADPKLPTRCIQCGGDKSDHGKLCAYGPNGKPLPEPLGDTEAEVIEAFCALSEMHPDTFRSEGYIVGPAPVIH